MKLRGKIVKGNKTSSHPNVDQTARYIGLASLLVSILAVIVPYVQQERTRIEAKEELLRIDAVRSFEHPIADSGNDFAKQGRLINEPWRITIANNSLRTISITQIEVERRDGERQIFYSGLNAGLTDLHGSKVHPPIQLPAGESKLLLAHVGVIAPYASYQALKPQFDASRGLIEPLLASRLLGRRKVDLYGNPVEFTEHSGGGFLLKRLSAKRTPAFGIRIRTGGGSEFFTMMDADHL